MQKINSSDILGCDLSHFEENLDIGSANGNIIFLKASEGQHTADPSFDTLYSKVKAAGKKVGAYHFLHVGGDYIVRPQVDNAIRMISGKPLDCLFGIDIEDGGYHGGTPQEVTEQLLLFADRFKANTGIPCCIYAPTAFIKKHFTKDAARLPLWVAHYGVSVPGENGIWDTWTGFQYTDKPYDLDAFTKGIFISGTAPQPGPGPSTKDVYVVQSLPCDWNAKSETYFDVRNADGSIVPGRQIYKGDKLIIRSVNFDRQLAEVIYPAGAYWVHGWVVNLQSKIKDRWHFNWRNGSTKEIVYGSPVGNDQIGSIGPHEKTTPLFMAAGRYALLYNTDKGEETKFGYVNYHDGFRF